MKAKRLLKLLVPAIAVTMGISSCQDYDADFTEKSIQYANEFEKAFGKVDPNHDWSMATRAQAIVNLPKIKGSAIMNIMTGDPRLSSTRLLAKLKLEEGQGSVTYDAIKGSDKVFVTIEQNGEYLVYSEFNASNGFLGIGDVQVPFTRGGAGSVVEKTAFSNPCTTTQETDAEGKFVVHSASEISFEGKYATSIKLGSAVKTITEWKKELVNVNRYTNNSPWTTMSLCNWAKYGPILTNATLMPNATDNGDGTITYKYNESYSLTLSVDKWKEKYTADNYTTQEPWSGVAWGKISCEFNATDYSIFADGFKDESEWELKPEGQYYYPTLNTQFQYLKNVEQVPSDPWSTSLGYSLFGDDAFFAETVEYWNSKKLGVYYTAAEMDDMEKGFSILTTGGQIELPYIFGVTSYADIFGYIYYKETDKDNVDPLALKHFVLIEDARPSENIFRINADGTETAVAGTSNYSASDFADYKAAIGGANQATEGNKQTRGTVYSPMFFGENYDQVTGTYNWPSGYRIIFFIDKVGTTTDDAAVQAHDNQKQYHFAYSLPELNLRLGKKYQNATDYPAKAEQGQVKCITWTRDGVTYMGFGDNSGDNDLNDIVIVVAGAYQHDDPVIKVAPIYWHNNYDGVHHDGTGTTTKNDDLYFEQSLNNGATYGAPAGTPTDPSGRTFLGWATEPNGTPVAIADFGTKTVSGTDAVCYFAIWSGETPSKVTIKWHTNITTPGEHKTNDSDLLPGSTLNLNPGDSYVQPTTPPVRAGYTFKGWSTDPTADPSGTFPAINTTAGTNDVCYFAIWEENTPPTPDPDWISWIFACEDLGGTYDYDFNDVVWEVRKNGTSGIVQARLLAAGGTLPFTLKYNSTEILTKTSVYGAGNESTVYLTVGSDWYGVLTDKDWSITDNSNKFSVVVEGHGDSHIIVGPTVGAPNDKQGSKAPEIILVPGNWEWPNENVCIKDAYKDFTNWVYSAGMTGWADSKQQGKTVSR